VSALCKKTHPRLGHAWAPLSTDDTSLKHYQSFRHLFPSILTTLRNQHPPISSMDYVERGKRMSLYNLQVSDICVQMAVSAAVSQKKVEAIYCWLSTHFYLTNIY
jgi:hypothetical protein